jgi:hypothetical protein
MAETVVFHPQSGFSMCYGGYSVNANEASAQPEHGLLVTCHVCRRTGVVPDEGHELEFLPPGTQRTPDGKSYILCFSPPGD